MPEANQSAVLDYGRPAAIHVVSIDGAIDTQVVDPATVSGPAGLTISTSETWLGCFLENVARRMRRRVVRSISTLFPRFRGRH